jgi:hypothetical protein
MTTEERTEELTRCVNCDHLVMGFQGPEGCRWTLEAGVVGENLVCRCSRLVRPVDGLPRVWSLPAEPGPEVTAVRDLDGCLYMRIGGKWLWDGNPNYAYRWRELLGLMPLSDASKTAAVSPSTDGYALTELVDPAMIGEARASVALDGDTQTLEGVDHGA